MSTPANSGNSFATNIGIGLVRTIALLAVLLRVAGILAAVATGARQPDGGLADGLRVLAEPGNPGTQLGTPELNPVLYWAIVAVLVLGVGTVAGSKNGWTDITDPDTGQHILRSPHGHQYPDDEPAPF